MFVQSVRFFPVSLMTKDDIVVCKCEGEYFALVGALHGQVVRLATNSKDYLNPMDIQLSIKGVGSLKAEIRFYHYSV